MHNDLAIMRVHRIDFQQIVARPGSHQPVPQRHRRYPHPRFRSFPRPEFCSVPTHPRTRTQRPGTRPDVPTLARRSTTMTLISDDGSSRTQESDVRPSPSLERVLNPSTIAVVGLSDKSPVAPFIEPTLDSDAEVFFVHPTAPTV